MAYYMNFTSSLIGRIRYPSTSKAIPSYGKTSSRLLIASVYNLEDTVDSKNWVD